MDGDLISTDREGKFRGPFGTMDIEEISRVEFDSLNKSHQQPQHPPFSVSSMDPDDLLTKVTDEEDEEEPVAPPPPHKDKFLVPSQPGPSTDKNKRGINTVTKTSTGGNSKNDMCIIIKCAEIQPAYTCKSAKQIVTNTQNYSEMLRSLTTFKAQPNLV